MPTMAAIPGTEDATCGAPASAMAHIASAITAADGEDERGASPRCPEAALNVRYEEAGGDRHHGKQ